jgi:ribonuclease BN (tRNA processing enzyme)
MHKVTIRVLGCGDAFGSGGRMQSSFFVASPDGRFLIDCGATSLVAMSRLGLDPKTIDAVLLSHLHGDHFGGLPFLLLQAHYVGRRNRPLVIAGPAGTESRIRDALEVLFPGSSKLAWRFPISFVEFRPNNAHEVANLAIEVYPVEHPSGAPSFALRVGIGDKIIAYTGDTRWTETLLAVAHDADIFLAECYSYDQNESYHLNYKTLLARRPELRTKRLVLTHMGEAMLRKLDQIEAEVAEDGMLLEI